MYVWPRLLSLVRSRAWIWCLFVGSLMVASFNNHTCKQPLGGGVHPIIPPLPSAGAHLSLTMPIFLSSVPNSSRKGSFPDPPSASLSSAPASPLPPPQTFHHHRNCFFSPINCHLPVMAALPSSNSFGPKRERRIAAANLYRTPRTLMSREQRTTWGMEAERRRRRRR